MAQKEAESNLLAYELRTQLMEVSRDAITAGSTSVDFGQMAQLAASLEATVLERDEARADVANLKTTYLGLLSSARDECQK
eukprot:3730383-Alexandrium_andersonii.AAC.1